MAVTVNGAVLTQTDVSDASPSTLTYTSVVLTGGDVLVAVLTQNGSTAFPAPAAPTGGTGLSWTQIVDEQNTAAHFSRVTAYWALVGSGQTSTLTQSTTVGAGVVGTDGALYRLSGADTSVPVGVSAVFQGQTDPTGASLQVTGTATGSMIFLAASDWSAGTAALTVSLTGVASTTTDLNNLESGQFRGVCARGAQSSSTSQATLDYTAATGDWAAVVFEIKQASASVPDPGPQVVPMPMPLLSYDPLMQAVVYPMRPWQRRFQWATQPWLNGDDVASAAQAATGQAQVGLTSSVTTVKRAVVTASCGAGFAPTSAAVKRSPASTTAALGLAGQSSARKVAPATGLAPAGFATNAVRTAAHAVTAATSFALAGLVSGQKRSTPTTSATLGLESLALAAKVARPSLNAPVGLAATLAAKKRATANANAPAGVAGLVTARKLATTTGLAGLGVASWAVKAAANSHAVTAAVGFGFTAAAAIQKRATVTAAGRLGVGAKAAGLITKRVVTGRATAGIGTAATAGKRQGVAGRTWAALASWVTYNRVPLGGSLTVVDRPATSLTIADRSTPALIIAVRAAAGLAAADRPTASLTQADRPTTTLTEGAP